MGRAVAHSTYAAGAEQARVESDYDVSNVIAVRSLERVATAGTTLSASNSVTRFTYKWHDSKNRVVASADLGAGADPATNPYATATPPSRGAAPIPIIGTDGRITQINRQGLPSWVRITCTAYNDQGQEAVVVAPNLSVTRKSYNGYGELVSTVENADSANPSDASRRITAYKYDSGRLVKIAAILDDVADPNWETYQGKVQITQLLYGDPANNDPGAEVVDSGGNSFTPPNFNGAWISQVRFPDPVTGLPSPTDTLTFKYFITGQIARRTDARGVVIRYTYDELGRCIRQTIDTSALAMPPGGSPLDVVRRVDFS